MKKLLLLLPMVALLAAGCSTAKQTDINNPVAQNENPSPAVINTTTSTPTSTITQENDWHVYTNTQFGFQMSFPNNTWLGGKVFQRSDVALADVTHIYFSVPTKDNSSEISGVTNSNGYAAPFGISIYPLKEWTLINQEVGPKPTKITQNSQYVFTYFRWQDAPNDLAQVNFAIQQLVDSFSLLNSSNPITTNQNTICGKNDKPWIKVTSPNGGETFVAGQKITVKWESCHAIAPISIILIKHSPSTAYTQSEGSGDYAGFNLGGFNPNTGTADDGIEQLTLPSSSDTNLVSGQHYFIIVAGQDDPSVGSGFNARDLSDKLFTIKF